MNHLSEHAIFPNAPLTSPPSFFLRQHIKLLLNEADEINFSSQLYHSLIDRRPTKRHDESQMREADYVGTVKFSKFDTNLINQIRIAS